MVKKGKPICFLYSKKGILILNLFLTSCQARLIFFDESNKTPSKSKMYNLILFFINIKIMLLRKRVY